MPFERPHQWTRPNVDWKPPAKERSWPGFVQQMQKRRQLAEVNRRVRYKDVGKLDLKRWAIGITPFTLGCQNDMAGQAFGPHRAGISKHVRELGLALGASG